MKKQELLRDCAPGVRAQQSGATLIVGLVLLLVLTVVGVSGMNTATMEVQMAANTQFQQDAFQQAENGIDIAIAQRVYAPAQQRTVDWLGGGAAYDRRAVTNPRDGINAPALGSSVGAIRTFHWDIVSVGRGPRNAISTHNQSFYVPASSTD